eukprot:474193_1
MAPRPTALPTKSNSIKNVGKKGTDSGTGDTESDENNPDEKQPMKDEDYDEEMKEIKEFMNGLGNNFEKYTPLCRKFGYDTLDDIIDDPSNVVQSIIKNEKDRKVVMEKAMQHRMKQIHQQDEKHQRKLQLQREKQLKRELEIKQQTQMRRTKTKTILVDKQMEMEQLRKFLQTHKLQQYFNALISNKADNLNDFEDLNEKEIIAISEQSKMKRLHQKQFVQAVQILQAGQYTPQKHSFTVLSDKEITIADEMKRFKCIGIGIRDEVTLPLHRFTPHDLHTKIKWWIYNDIKYQKHLQMTMKIVSENRLSGAVMCSLSKDSPFIIRMLSFQLEEFMNSETIITNSLSTF